MYKKYVDEKKSNPLRLNDWKTNNLIALIRLCPVDCKREVQWSKRGDENMSNNLKSPCPFSALFRENPTNFLIIMTLFACLFAMGSSGRTYAAQPHLMYWMGTIIITMPKKPKFVDWPIHYITVKKKAWNVCQNLLPKTIIYFCYEILQVIHKCSSKVRRLFLISLHSSFLRCELE